MKEKGEWLKYDRIKKIEFGKSKIDLKESSRDGFLLMMAAVMSVSYFRSNNSISYKRKPAKEAAIQTDPPYSKYSIFISPLSTSSLTILIRNSPRYSFYFLSF